jgi:hypothetical protein
LSFRFQYPDPAKPLFATMGRDLDNLRAEAEFERMISAPPPPRE